MLKKKLKNLKNNINFPKLKKRCKKLIKIPEVQLALVLFFGAMFYGLIMLSHTHNLPPVDNAANTQVVAFNITPPHVGSDE